MQKEKREGNKEGGKERNPVLKRNLHDIVEKENGVSSSHTGARRQEDGIVRRREKNYRYNYHWSLPSVFSKCCQSLGVLKFPLLTSVQRLVQDERVAGTGEDIGYCWSWHLLKSYLQGAQLPHQSQTANSSHKKVLGPKAKLVMIVCFTGMFPVVDSIMSPSKILMP